MVDRPLKILLIEDNPSDVRLIREMLAEVRSFYSNLIVTDCLSEGLEYLIKGEIDITLLDLSLPNIKGLDTFVKVQSHSPKVPIVVLTGLNDDLIAVKAVREGAQDYLVKGQVDSNVLVRSIRYAIERKRTEEELRKAHDELERRVQERTAELTKVNEELQAEIIRSRRIEEELLQEKMKLEDVTSYANCGLLLLDAQTRVIYANRIAQDWFGPFHRIKGRFCWEIFKLKIPKKECAALKVLITGMTIRSEIFAQVINGEEKFFYGITSPVKGDDGEVRQVNVVIIDITERKKADELRLENERLTFSNKAKSEFLANMSHELRTPLNAIIGFSELLEQKTYGELNEKQERYVGNIIISSKHLLNLINDVLDLSKVEAGRIELEIEKISVLRTITEIITIIKEKAAQHNIIIRTELDIDLEYIEADRQRFKQILFNLLSNAVKFSKKEGGMVTITTKKEDVMAKISISDTGIGIKEEDIGRLFKEFGQLNSINSGKHDGIGLGLAITKKLVELHGGSIAVQSKYNEGSTFTFLLPLKQNGDE